MVNTLFNLDALALTESLASHRIIHSVAEIAGDIGSSVLCSSSGVPSHIRVERRRNSRWMVEFDAWSLEPDIASLGVLDSSFKHIGLGTKPTASSMGRRTMRYCWDIYSLPRLTSLPLSAENFILVNGFGGITYNGRLGRIVPLASQLDMSSAYLSQYDLHPDGTAVFFRQAMSLYQFATYFATCTVTIKQDLPLGVFPVRVRKKRVVYPTKKGVYHTHLWSEQVDAAREYGCEVEVHEGWGWPKFHRLGQYWAEWMYEKRLTAPTKEVEKIVKRVSVSGIGSHGRRRDGFTLVTGEKYSSNTDFPVWSDIGPIDLWVHPDRDDRSAILYHNHEYTIARTNLLVAQFAYPFAEAGNLLMIDYDSVFLEGDYGDRYVHRNTVEGQACRPGTWLYKLHHRFTMSRPRIWRSDEEPDRHGAAFTELPL